MEHCSLCMWEGSRLLTREVDLVMMMMTVVLVMTILRHVTIQ